jgi:16S rRNA processing protein RimM
MAVASSWRSSPTTERLAVARVTGVKGLRGAMRIEPLTDRPERLAPGEEIYVEGEASPRRIVDVEWGGRIPAITLDGIVTRESAEALKDRYLEVDAAELPEGTYYWHQLEGLQVVDPNGTSLGTLISVFRVGENEVYRVENEAGEELLIPALRDVVREIDLPNGRMTVDYELEDV